MNDLRWRRTSCLTFPIKKLWMNAEAEIVSFACHKWKDIGFGPQLGIEVQVYGALIQIWNAFSPDEVFFKYTHSSIW